MDKKKKALIEEIIPNISWAMLDKYNCKGCRMWTIMKTYDN